MHFAPDMTGSLFIGHRWSRGVGCLRSNFQRAMSKAFSKVAEFDEIISGKKPEFH